MRMNAITYAGVAAIVLLLSNVALAEMRTWTTTSGKTIEGKYITTAFDAVNVEDPNGKLIKIPLETLSAEDRLYADLINYPKLSIDFLESAKQFPVKPSPLWGDNSPIAVLDHTFGARIKHTSAGEYNHKLVIEGYELSQQVWDLNKYRLIHRYKSEPFVFTKKNRAFEYRSPETIRLVRITVDQGTGAALPRGQRKAESIVLVRDERGEVIAYRSTAKWLYEHLDKLEKLPVNAWMNKQCERVHPSSPPPYKLGYLPSTY